MVLALRFLHLLGCGFLVAGLGGLRGGRLDGFSAEGLLYSVEGLHAIAMTTELYHKTKLQAVEQNRALSQSEEDAVLRPLVESRRLSN